MLSSPGKSTASARASPAVWHARAARNPQVANRRALKRVVLVAEGDRSHDIAIRALQLQGHDITITRDEAWAERLACGL